MMAAALRTTLRVAAALALVTVFAAFVPPGAASAQGAEVQIEDRVFRIGRQLRCPTCVSESVADSSSAIATEMRLQIRELLQDGASEREVLAHFRERYGDWILLEPPREGIHLAVWLLPVVALSAGVGGLALLMVRWTKTAQAHAAAEPPSPDELAQVREALALDDEEARS